MNKTLGIIDSDNKELIFAIEKYFASKDVEVKVISVDYNMAEFDLVVSTDFKLDGLIKHSNILSVFPALLPSFKDEENPILASFLSGVKVTGITIYSVMRNKILAQYPVLIGLDTTILELTEELLNIAQKVYPVVIDAVLNDKVFDFSDLMTSKCNSGCGACGGCH